MPLQALDSKSVEQELKKYREEYENYRVQNLQLDLSRGRPSREQLDISMKLLDELTSNSVTDAENGTDCRNYGLLDGIPEARQLMGELIGVPASKMMVFGNSSLEIMYLVLTHAMMDGLSGCAPMVQQSGRKFLCPSPGYDRHFALTQYMGFELITIPMTDEGPDMDLVRKYAENDETVKGIWCVPKFSNPTGTVYSDRVVREFAALKPAAADFRIYWDNAYCVHELYPGEEHPLADIVGLCEEAGSPDMVYEFCSTSKLAFPGSGIAGVAASLYNRNDLKNMLQYLTIGPDKLNQLRQVRYFKNLHHVKKHMMKQADIMRPKFDLVEEILSRELGELGVAEWTLPRGGYFISLDTLPGCARRVVALAKEAGVKFTGAGATYPYGIDPADRNIRLAPSFATLEEIRLATEILTVCVKIASAEKILADGEEA